MDGSKEPPRMTAGLDLGDKYSYLCLIDTLSVCENTSTAFAARPIAGLTRLNGCDIAKAHTSDLCVGVGFPRLFASNRLEWAVDPIRQGQTLIRHLDVYLCIGDLEP